MSLTARTSSRLRARSASPDRRRPPTSGESAGKRPRCWAAPRPGTRAWRSRGDLLPGAILLVECRTKRELGVLAAHALAVVPDPDELLSAGDESTAISVAPASREFSTSSLTTDTGRSMTSPAAIFWETPGGRTECGSSCVWFTISQRSRRSVGTRDFDPDDRTGRPLLAAAHSGNADIEIIRGQDLGPGRRCL